MIKMQAILLDKPKDSFEEDLESPGDGMGEINVEEENPKRGRIIYCENCTRGITRI